MILTIRALLETMKKGIGLDLYTTVSLALLITIVISTPQVTFAQAGRLNPESCQNDNSKDANRCQRSKAPSRYARADFGYRSYTASTNTGFYTKKTCSTNIDHVVSLKDAHESGASSWPILDKETFANDKTNHVATCVRVNSSKGASTPSNFLRKSSDGKGLDYKIVDFCGYLEAYFRVKTKYGLSFSNNNAAVFIRCGVNLDKR